MLVIVVLAMVSMKGLRRDGYESLWAIDAELDVVVV